MSGKMTELLDTLKPDSSRAAFRALRAAFPESTVIERAGAWQAWRREAAGQPQS